MLAQEDELLPHVRWAGLLRRLGRITWRTLAEIDLPVKICSAVLLSVLGISTLVYPGPADAPSIDGSHVAFTRLALGGTDKDRLTTIFNGLSEGGRVNMPLTAQSWGAELGWLKDKFGITWMVSIEKA